MTPSRRGVRLRPRLRLRDIPFLPLLLLLHVVFTLSSLLLRLYEALTTSSTLPPRTFVPPKHVALSLPASVPVTTGRGRSRTETQSAAAVRRRKELELERAAVGSVLRAARWAVREGVETVSVHESSGGYPDSAMHEPCEARVSHGVPLTHWHRCFVRRKGTLALRAFDRPSEPLTECFHCATRRLGPSGIDRDARPARGSGRRGRHRRWPRRLLDHRVSSYVCTIPTAHSAHLLSRDRPHSDLPVRLHRHAARRSAPAHSPYPPSLIFQPRRADHP
jgi:hypothetical protein